MSLVGCPRASWTAFTLSMLAATALIACGGDDSDDESNGEAAQTKMESPAPTKAEFIAAADKECAIAIRRNKPIFDKIDEAVARQDTASKAGQSIAGPLREQAKLWGRIADARKALTAELEALEPPATGTPDRYLRARNQATAATEQYAKALSNAADTASEATYGAVEERARRLGATSKRARQQARAYGFKTCETPAE